MCGRQGNRLPHPCTPKPGTWVLNEPVSIPLKSNMADGRDVFATLAWM